jgi:hypothetical protein
MSNITPKIKVLHYLFSKPAEKIIAHCLDFDIVTTANDQINAEQRLDILVKLYVEFALNYGNYAALNSVAPNRFWDAFRSAKRIEPVNPTLKIMLPEIVPVEHSEGHIGVLAAMAA